MITFVTHLRVNAANAAAFEALISDVCAKVRENEPGVIYYDFAKSADSPNTYLVIEVYRDETALQAHAEADYVKTSVPKTSVLIEDGRYDIKQYVSPGTQPVRLQQ